MSFYILLRKASNLSISIRSTILLPVPEEAVGNYKTDRIAGGR